MMPDIHSKSKLAGINMELRVIDAMQHVIRIARGLDAWFFLSRTLGGK
jgi:hypothetical protein